MRFLRVSLAILVLLITIVVLAAISLMVFVDPNKLKPVLAEEVMDQTGYKLAIDGDLSWSFYPRVSIKVKRMTLTAPQQTKPFLDLQDIKIATKLSQLWHHREKLSGKIYIASANYMNLNIQDISTDLHWEKNILTLQPIKAALYGGTLEGIAHGSQFSAIPHWDWDVKLSQIQLQPMLQDMNGQDSKLRLSGVGQVKFQGYTEGKDKAQAISNLNGATEFSVTQGVLDGVNLNYFVQTADALLNRQEITAPTDLNQTNFDSFTGTAVIKNGVASTNDLTLTSPAFITKAEGVVTLTSNTLDFQLQIKPQRDEASTAKRDWAVPVLISGDLNRPDVRLNMDEVRKVVMSQQLDKVKDKARDVIKEHVSGKAGEFLQNLLGPDNK